MIKRVGLSAGVGLFFAMQALPVPAGLSAEGWAVAAVAVLMALWWFTEAVPLTMTALLPFLLLPLLGAGSAGKIAGTYYSPILFLVLGGAIVAIAIEKAGLHRRVALAVAARGGASPRRLVLAFMAATAIVSMIVSNTATALIMTPVALALIRARGQDDGFAPALLLGVAYAASIGGLGTLVGSPTNGIAAAMIDRTLDIRIDFVTWSTFGLPMVFLGVPAAAWLLNRALRVPHAAFDRQAVLAAIGTPGAWSPLEKRVAPLVVALILGWTVLPLIKDRIGLSALDDGMTAIAAALLLFILPGGNGRPILEWPDARGVPWDVIMMFGGGLALADAITASGLALWIGQQLSGLGTIPIWALALLLTALVILVTEFASNVATASGFLPVVAGVATATGLDPLALAMPAALAASWGFMMPAGTGPNAIAYATGQVRVGQMVRAGFLIDLLGIPLIVAVCFAVAP
ncbi:MAG: DASS family sodium-coupled anion symporter [Sphingomonadales bacterium]|nr:MAG: DASS family sodium-coupled anion symporter [Sphingomonadales bacterium]